jgi:hypothetical protein
MKNYISTSTGVWSELVPVYLTEYQKQILQSNDPSLKEEREALLRKIASERSVSVSQSIASELNAIYDRIKPTVRDGDVFYYVAMSACFRNQGYSGILNYRINNEQKQIRF